MCYILEKSVVTTLFGVSEVGCSFSFFEAWDGG